MSRRRGNNITGPTSALTEFLREQGITPTTIARRAATQAQPAAGPSNAPQQEEAEEAEGGENADDGDEEEEAASKKRKRAGKRKAADYDSDDLDDKAEEQPKAKKPRKLTKAQEAKMKAAEKAKQKKKKGEDDDEEEDPYNALSKNLWTMGAKPPVGSFEECANCKSQFTVTKYTIAAASGDGFLCHKCAKDGGTDPFKKAPAPKRKKIPADKRSVTHYDEKRFPTLASLCIKVISQHIDDVEAFGDIGALNLAEISKAISKNRSLTTENAVLFYSADNTSLMFHDATNLTPDGFKTLAQLNANLVSLRLDFCGRMDDEVAKTWCTSLPSLRRLELLGPFLVRVDGWISFFKSHPDLEGFLITQSPRFDEECTKELVENCKGLKEVRLKEVGKMNDGFLEHLMTLEHLTYLDLSDPTESCSEDALAKLLAAVGSGLSHLDLSRHDLITDNFIVESLGANVQKLTSLVMSSLPDVTDKGFSKLFENWMNVAEPLTSIDLSKNPELAGQSLRALLKHSGSALQSLSINGWKATPQEALGMIPKGGRSLKTIDVGWCREVDDFLIKSLIEECGSLKEIKTWGCNRLTENCPRKRGVAIYGVEAQRVI